MSRNLYTIAVISRGIESDLRFILNADDDDRIQRAEAFLLDSLGGTDPKVAFYRTLLDGWNRTHSHFDSDRNPWLSDLDSAGFAWPPSESLHPKSTLQRDNLGAYGMSALLSALHEASIFSSSTNCRVIVLWRNVGPSFDNAEFR